MCSVILIDRTSLFCCGTVYKFTVIVIINSYTTNIRYNLTHIVYNTFSL